MAELSDAVHDEIGALCEEGDDHAAEGRFAAALKAYDAAWKLLPEPKHEWEAATWILAAVGDAHFLTGQFAPAREALNTAMRCPDGIGNPFLHLRLGQCAFEMRDMDRAADELMRAYMGGGAEIFEDDDAKYIAFLRTRAKDID